MNSLHKNIALSLILFSSGCAYISDAAEEKRLDPDEDNIEWPDDCDNDNPGVGKITWYEDADADGFGNPDVNKEQCEQPEGYVQNDQDCDDSDEALTAADNDEDGFSTCDGDCDDEDNSKTPLDNDDDGYSTCEGDCNDSEPEISPEATEICDTIDNDCDGNIDDEDNSLDTATADTYYADSDADGYGEQNAALFCEQPPGYVTNNTDCDDTNASINETATEVCDTIDNDCDGNIDDEDDSLDTATGSIFYKDNDSDGYGNNNVSQMFCVQQNGFVVDNTDCNDNNPMSYPQADEYCDYEDNDCDQTVDENPVDGTFFYEDLDGDGYGNPSSYSNSCNLPIGYVQNALDCDDTNSEVNPDALEICNGINDDCSSLTLETGLVTQMSNPPVNITVSQDPTAPSTHTVTTADTWNFCSGDYHPQFTIEDSVSFVGVDNDVRFSGDGSPIIGIYTDAIDFDLQNITIANFTPSLYHSPIWCDNSDWGSNNQQSVIQNTINLQDVSFADNLSLPNGILYSYRCDINADNITLQNNDGQYLYGFYAYHADIAVSNSTFEQNTTNYGGAFDLNYSNLSLDNTNITGDFSEAVITAYSDSTVTCTDSSFTDNITIDGAIQLYSGTTFTSTQCSFGTATNNDDNTPYDISTRHHTYLTGDNVDFSCTYESGCGTELHEVIGQALTTSALETSTKLRGNYFEVVGTPTLNSFGLHLACSGFQSSCLADLYFFVHTRPSSTDPWTLVYSDVRTDYWPSQSFVSSSPIGIALNEGEQVALSVGWEGTNMSYSYDYPYSLTTSFAIGEWQGGIIGNNIDITNPTISTIANNAYYQTFSTTKLE